MAWQPQQLRRLRWAYLDGILDPPPGSPFALLSGTFGYRAALLGPRLLRLDAHIADGGGARNVQVLRNMHNAPVGLRHLHGEAQVHDARVVALWVRAEAHRRA